MRAPLLRLLCFAPYLVLAACDGGQPMAPTPSTTVEFVTIAPANVHLLPGGQVALSATPRNADRNPLDRPVTWASSDPALATVSSDGLVSAVAAGSVLITAESDGVVGEVVLAVDEGGIVGPEGGEVRAFDGQVLLTVPAGAVTEPASIFLTRSPSAPLDATAAGEPVHVRSTQALAAPGDPDPRLRSRRRAGRCPRVGARSASPVRRRVDDGPGRGTRSRVAHRLRHDRRRAAHSASAG